MTNTAKWSLSKKIKTAALSAAFVFSFNTLAIVGSGFRFSESSLDNLSKVDHRISDIAKLALYLSDIDFGVSSGLRTDDEQKRLFENGHTKADGITIKSRHQSGCAIDVFAYVDGKASYEERHMKNVYKYMSLSSKILGHEIIWGGDWETFIDMPHFELKDC